MNELAEGEGFVVKFEMEGKELSFMVMVPNNEPQASQIVFPKDMEFGGRILNFADVPAMLRPGEHDVLKSVFKQALAFTLQKCMERPSPDAAVFFSRLLAEQAGDPDEQAGVLMFMGNMFEQRADFSEAVRFYREACALRPPLPHHWYFSNNNLAYNLNQLGLYAEAEPHCREAIRTEPLRHNAHKNLGVSLQGQGRWAEAADSYGRATEACPFDPRAAGHMEAMLKEHPEVRGMLEAREKAAAPEVSGAEQLQVVLHKGEQGLGEHAVETLMKVFGHSPEMAAKLMAEAECRGQAIVQVEERDLAVMHREMLHAAGFRVEVQTL